MMSSLLFTKPTRNTDDSVPLGHWGKDPVFYNSAKAVRNGNKEVVEVIIDFIEGSPEWDLKMVIEGDDGVSTKRKFNSMIIIIIIMKLT